MTDPRLENLARQWLDARADDWVRMWADKLKGRVILCTHELLLALLEKVYKEGFEDARRRYQYERDSIDI